MYYYLPGFGAEFLGGGLVIYGIYELIKLCLPALIGIFILAFIWQVAACKPKEYLKFLVKYVLPLAAGAFLTYLFFYLANSDFIDNGGLYILLIILAFLFGIAIFFGTFYVIYKSFYVVFDCFRDYYDKPVFPWILIHIAYIGILFAAMYFLGDYITIPDAVFEKFDELALNLIFDSIIFLILYIPFIIIGFVKKLSISFLFFMMTIPLVVFFVIYYYAEGEMPHMKHDKDIYILSALYFGMGFLFSLIIGFINIFRRDRF